jgi:putative ABC transport system substrate-binding protein
MNLYTRNNIKNFCYRVILFLGFLLPAVSLYAQERPFKIYMVLWTGEDNLSKGFMDYFKRNNIEVEYTIKSCDQDRKKCHALVQEIREAKPDLIFTWGTPVCEEIGGKIDAQDKSEYIWDIPMVSLIVTDPVRSKLIYDLNKPGRNITGVNHVAPVPAHLESMKAYLKNLKKIGALYNPGESNSQIMVDEIVSEAQKSGIQVVRYPVPLGADQKPDPNAIEGLIDKMAKEKVEFIYMPADTFLSVNMGAVSKAANRNRIPTFGSTESMFFYEGKPLMGLLSRFYDVGLFGGLKAEQILLKKADIKTMPYEKLQTFSLIIDAKTFREIKIYPPLTLMKFAEVTLDK